MGSVEGPRGKNEQQKNMENLKIKISTSLLVMQILPSASLILKLTYLHPLPFFCDTREVEITSTGFFICRATPHGYFLYLLSRTS